MQKAERLNGYTLDWDKAVALGNGQTKFLTVPTNVEGAMVNFTPGQGDLPVLVQIFNVERKPDAPR